MYIKLYLNKLEKNRIYNVNIQFTFSNSLSFFLLLCIKFKTYISDKKNIM